MKNGLKGIKLSGASKILYIIFCPTYIIQIVHGLQFS